MTSIEIDEYFQTSLSNNLSTLLDRIINGKKFHKNYSVLKKYSFNFFNKIA